MRLKTALTQWGLQGLGLVFYRISSLWHKPPRSQSPASVNGLASVLPLGFLYLGVRIVSNRDRTLGGAWKRGKSPQLGFGNSLLRGGSWRLSPACLTIRARAETHRLRVLQRHLLGQELHWGTEGRWELGQLRWFPRRQQLQQGQGDRPNALVTNRVSKRASVCVALSCYCPKEYIIFKIKRFFNIDEIVWQLHFPYPIPTTGRIKVFENVSVYLIFPKYKKEVSEREELCDSELRMTRVDCGYNVKVFIDTPQENNCVKFLPEIISVC